MMDRDVLFGSGDGIGMGIVGYALAVTIYTMLALWRNRRMARSR
jgi:hypothetical protein